MLLNGVVIYWTYNPHWITDILKGSENIYEQPIGFEKATLAHQM